MDGLAEPIVMSEAEMGPIPHDLLIPLWPVLEPLLEKACAYSEGRFTPESVGLAVTQGEFDLWGAMRDGAWLAIAVTCVSDYPSGLRVMEVLLVSGEDRQSWLHFEKPLRTQARKWNCHKMQMVGRRGWGKSLPDWRAVATMYEVDVSDGL
jgi:hypothetical protein